MPNNEPKPFMNPYLAGILLSLAQLASFLVLGTGLGASGGLTRIAAFTEGCVLPGHVASSAYFGRWTMNPLAYYLVFMLAGTVLGGLLSALAAGRVHVELERGRRAPPKLRASLALLGGVLVGCASRVAAGCTSGQALTGGALLLSGSLVFMACMFVGGYGAAYFVKSQWHD